MTTINDFGIPMGFAGTGKGIPMMALSYRFKISRCHPQITQNVEKIQIDYANNLISMSVRVTYEPESFKAAQAFGRTHLFFIDAMDGGDASFFSLRPVGLKIKEHKVEFNYAISDPVKHHYTWSFDDMVVMTPQPVDAKEEPVVEDDGFITPETALKAWRSDAGC